MTKLKESERVILEKLLGMQDGYLLNFTNLKFQQFISNNFGKDIYSDKYSIYGDSKAKRLRAFWCLEDDLVVGKLILELLEVWRSELLIEGKEITQSNKLLYEKSKLIANRLLGITFQEKNFKETIDDFLNRDFEDISFVKLNIESSVIDILELRIIEIKNLIKSKSALSCVILCGSVLEGVLLGIANSKMREFNQCEISPKNKVTSKVLPFNQWSLSNLIDVSHSLGLLGLDVKKYSHSLRDFRNYIHPYEQLSSKFNPDIETAKISWQILKAAVSDLSKET